MYELSNGTIINANFVHISFNWVLFKTSHLLPFKQVSQARISVALFDIFVNHMWHSLNLSQQNSEIWMKWTITLLLSIWTQTQYRFWGQQLNPWIHTFHSHGVLGTCTSTSMSNVVDFLLVGNNLEETSCCYVQYNGVPFESYRINVKN